MADYTDIDDSSAFFQTKLYTGNGGTNAITFDGLNDMQPDWVWIKNRTLSGGYAHNLFDSVRGTNKKLVTNDTRVETSETNALNSFNSNGFTLGEDSGTEEVNRDDGVQVSWNWKAGTSFSNDASATSVVSIDSVGSVSTTAGFSIISWTSPNNSVATIAHGLGSVPTMIIMKKRGATGGWVTYHRALENTHGIFLSTTAAKEDNAAFFNDTSPTSTVFTTGSDAALVSNTMIAYCFADVQGFSKMGSYVGNGNANGPYIHLGFKPAFLLVKLASGTDDWQILDNKRSPNNIVGGYLRPNDSGVTVDNDVIDFTSNGFKLRTSAGSWNPAGGTFIYMAFAEQPFVTSTGVSATAR